MKEKKIDFSKCKPKLHVLYPCRTVFNEKMLQSAAQRSSVRYPPIGSNGFTDALRSPLTHTNMCTHVIDCHSQSVCTVFSTVRVLYVLYVQCTCKMHCTCTCTVQRYSRVVPLNDLAFTYKIVHSYTPNECSVRGEYEYSLQTEAGYRAKSPKKEQEGPSTSLDYHCFYQ